MTRDSNGIHYRFRTMEKVAGIPGFTCYAVRWPVTGGIHGGFASSAERNTFASVVAIPDADQTPEMLAGIAPGTAC